MRLRFLSLLFLLPVHLTAQVARDSRVDWLLSAGSEGERYVRILQVAGLAPQTSWLAHGAGAFDLVHAVPERATHPWAASFLPRRDAGAAVRAFAPEATARFNTRFPYGYHDGPVWAGRGLTTSLVFGGRAVLGALDVTIAPVLFRAENSDFPVPPNGSAQPFANAIYPNSIDAPERFGSGPYQRLDPGQSTVRLRALGFAVGASTANEIWGPALDSPFLLSDNAAGFAHAFLGTDGQRRLGPMLVTARAIAGRLDQSDYSTTTFDRRRRYVSGFLASLSLTQVPNLEFGVARTLANSWPDSGVSVAQVLRPIIQGPFKVQRIRAVGNSGDEPDNQLASLFFRWAFPSSGLELYGEYGREDNAYDVRDLLLEPDHDVGYVLGFQRAWAGRKNSLTVVRAEVFNSRISHLGAVRPPAPSYIHGPVTQGHTQLGQFLGAQGGLGGGAHQLVVERYTSSGRRSLFWNGYLRPAYHQVDGSFLERYDDAVNAIGFEQLRFGKHVDVRAGLTSVYNFNRDGQSDQVNWQFSLGVSPHR